MLCLQQCIDLCELAPEEAEAIRQRASLAEILSIQAECPRCRGTAGDEQEGADGCGMLDLRDRLLDADYAADDLDDLEDVVHEYCGYGGGADNDVAVNG